MLYGQFAWASCNWVSYLILRTLKASSYHLQVMVNAVTEISKASLDFYAFNSQNLYILSFKFCNL